MPRCLRVVALAALLLGSVFPALPQQSTGGGIAEGSLTVNGKKTDLRHAYAVVTPDAFDKTKNGLLLLITDTELPAAAMTDQFQMMDLERAGKVHGLRFEFSSEKQVISGSLISNDLDGSVSGVWGGMFKATTFDEKTIAGEAVLSEPETIFKNTFTYAVKAEAPIVRPPKPVPASATEIKTAEASPQAAVYRKYLKALETGDRNTLRTVVTREHRKNIDSPDFAKMLKVIQELIATDVKVQKLTVNGDSAVLEATGKDRVSGAGAAGTIKMAREDGAWKIIGDEWKAGGN